jgi:hypothetical protein
VVSERLKGRTELSSKPVSSNATPDYITFMSGNDLTEPRGRTGMFKQYYPERSSYNVSKCYSMFVLQYFNVPSAFDHWTDELSLDRLPNAPSGLATGSVMACNPFRFHSSLDSPPKWVDLTVSANHNSRQKQGPNMPPPHAPSSLPTSEPPVV